MHIHTKAIMGVSAQEEGVGPYSQAYLMIGGGAGLSALAGAILSTETGAWPLLALMSASAFCSVIAASYVIRRARAVAQE